MGPSFSHSTPDEPRDISQQAWPVSLTPCLAGWSSVSLMIR
uniref:Uncharacterized protein n=1 Tax=Arundo donax TaxID=35708 RepID=A0A0A9F5I4_ARUDO